MGTKRGGSSRVFGERNVPPRLPASIVKNIDRTNFRRLLQVVTSSISGKALPDHVLSHITLTPTATADTEWCREEQACRLYSTLHHLCYTLLAWKRNAAPAAAALPQSVIEEMQEMNLVPTEYVDDIVRIINKDTTQIKVDGGAPHRENRSAVMPSLERFRWRIDVVISNSDVSRVLEPAIMLEVTLTSGQRHIIQTTVSTFHELRYKVACILQSVEDVERRIGADASRHRALTQ